MFSDGLGDMPGAFKTDGENDIIAGAETDRLPGGGAVIDGDLPFENEAFFGLVAFPVEFVRLVCPDRPALANLGLGGGGLAYDDIFYSRHKDSFPKSFIAGIVRGNTEIVN
jgi:hypothetical protein